MELEVGDYVQVKTKSRAGEGNFGTVMYKVLEKNTECPHCVLNDGIRFLMIGGSGTSAHFGRIIVDCPYNIDLNEKLGLLKKMDKAVVENMKVTNNKHLTGIEI